MAKAYDFSKTGAGEYSVKPSNRFTTVDENGNPQDVYATVGDTAKVKLSGDLSSSSAQDKWADPASCSPAQVLQLNTSAGDAQLYAKTAFAYISGVSNGTARYTTWFGAYDGIRQSTVKNHFQAINAGNFSKFTYDCTCTTPTIYAYVCA